MKKTLIVSTIFSASLAAGSALAEAGAEKESKIKHKGTIEGGITIENGNTDSENYRGSFELISEYDIYKNEFKADGSNTKQNNVRTGEEYNISNQLKAHYDEENYGFAEVEFTEDRYQGFNYRTSELVGLGHYFVKEEALKVIGEVGVGARQTDYKQREDEETFIGRVSGDIEWKINEHVTFGHRTDYTVGDDNNITQMETSLKAFLQKSLYVRLAHELEHNSDVPSPTVNNTDTRTFFTVGYDF